MKKETQPKSAVDLAKPTSQAPSPDYAQRVEYDPADFPEGEREGWQDFYEPLGDESHLEVRIIPEQAIAGQPAKVLLIASSAYGRPQPKAFMRFGDPKASDDIVGRQPNQGPPWTELQFVGGRIMDLNTRKMVPLGQTEENRRAEQPGESYYQIGLIFPPGKTWLDVKFETDSRYLGTVSFRAMEVDAITAP